MKRILVFLISFIALASCNTLYKVYITNCYGSPVILRFSKERGFGMAYLVSDKDHYIAASENKYEVVNKIFSRGNINSDCELKMAAVCDSVTKDTLSIIRVSNYLFTIKDGCIKLPFKHNDTILGEKYVKLMNESFCELPQYVKMQYYYNVGNHNNVKKLALELAEHENDVVRRNSLLLGYLSSYKMEDKSTALIFRKQLMEQFVFFWDFLIEHDPEVKKFSLSCK